MIETLYREVETRANLRNKEVISRVLDIKEKKVLLEMEPEPLVKFSNNTLNAHNIIYEELIKQYASRTTSAYYCPLERTEIVSYDMGKSNDSKIYEADLRDFRSSMRRAAFGSYDKYQVDYLVDDKPITKLSFNNIIAHPTFNFDTNDVEEWIEKLGDATYCDIYCNKEQKTPLKDCFNYHHYCPVSWVPENYICILSNHSEKKPFAYRHTEATGLIRKGNTFTREYGIGICDKDRGVIIQLGTNKYEEPNE